MIPTLLAMTMSTGNGFERETNIIIFWRLEPSKSKCYRKCSGMKMQKCNSLIEIVYLPLIALSSPGLEMALNFRAIDVNCILHGPLLSSSFNKILRVLRLTHLCQRERSLRRTYDASG